ncbi:MAG TPA: alpha/beta hydrolase [Caulobacteraceae bacterium]
MSLLEFGVPDRAVDLIFLHANGFNALAYRRLFTPLADRFRILAVDQRGHGATSLNADPLGRANWDDFRDDLVALLDLLGVREAVLCGHSMGGATCLTATALRPGRVRRLVLLDPVIVAPRPGPDSSETNLAEGARRRRAEFPSREAALAAYAERSVFSTWRLDMLADYVTAGFRDLPDGSVRLACAPAWEASTFAVAAHSDTWTAFDRTRCPVEIIKAEVGSTCQTGPQEPALTASGRITVETLFGTSHFLPMEKPEAIAARLDRAVSGG